MEKLSFKGLKSVCFTGHRNVKRDRILVFMLKDLLEEMFFDGVRDFYAGGSIGWDTIAARVVLYLRRFYPQIKLHLVLPCSNEEQTKEWTQDQLSDFYEILALADTVEYISDNYHKDCMKKRNARLVELADCCVCFCNSARNRSGSAQTVRMAQKKGVRIINLFGYEAYKEKNISEMNSLEFDALLHETLSEKSGH